MATVDFGINITADGKSAVGEIKRTDESLVELASIAKKTGASFGALGTSAEEMQRALANLTAAGVNEARQRAEAEAGYKLSEANQRDLAEQTRRRAAAALDATRAAQAHTAALRAEAAAAAVQPLNARASTAAAQALAQFNAESAKAVGQAMLLERAQRDLNAQLERGIITKKQYAGAMANLQGGATAAAPAVGGLASSLGSLGTLGKAGVFALVAREVASIGMAAVDSQLKIEKMRKALEFGAGGKTQAAAEFEYLKKTANDLGLNLEQTIGTYAKFAAASRGTALEGEGTRRVFESVAKASSVMGLGVDEQSGVFLALSQMMAKGKVSAEEFRGQLGERLPIAAKAGADALGITQAEFAKLLDSGQLLSEEFLPKFAGALEKAVGKQAQDSAKGLGAEIERLKNAWADLTVQSGPAGEIFSLVAAKAAKAATSILELWNASKHPLVREREEALAAQKAYDDLRASTDRLKASNVSYNKDFITLLRLSFDQGKITAGQFVETFTTYEKRLVELAAEGKEKIELLSSDAAKAQAKLVDQILREQEKRTLSSTELSIREAEREAAARREIAAGNSGLLELIETELQAKLKALREGADAARIAAEAKTTEAAAAQAEKRVEIERGAATEIAAAYQTANAAKAGVPVINNAGTPGAFQSSWDAAGNYIGSLGTTSSGGGTPGALGNAFSASGRKLSIAEEIAMLNGARFAAGGRVHGPGTGTSDSIVARLSAGEYVVRAAAVQAVGQPLLDRINAAPGFAAGGMVGFDSAQAKGSGSGVWIDKIEIHVHDASDVDAIGAQMRDRLRRNPAWLTAGLRRAG